MSAQTNGEILEQLRMFALCETVRAEIDNKIFLELVEQIADQMKKEIEKELGLDQYLEGETDDKTPN